MAINTTIRTFLAILTCLCLSRASQAAPARFYWTNGWTSPANSGNGPAGTVNRIDANGANPVVLATQGASGGQLWRVCDVELDQARQVIYFNNWNSGAPVTDEGIYRTSLNGTGQVLFTTANSAGTGFDSGLHRISIDPANGDVYFTRGVSYANSNGPEVSRVNVTGGGYTQLYGAPGDGWFTSGLDLDPATGDVYWGDSGVIYNPPAGAANVMDNNGANPTELVPWGGGNGQGRSLAFDGSVGLQGTLFYSAWTTAGGVFNGPQNGGGGIWSLDINSGVVTQLLNDPTTGIPDIEVDTIDQRLYWTDYVRGEIRSFKYDGTDMRTEISGLLNPFGLAIEPVPEPSSLVLATLGIAVFGAAAWRKRCRQVAPSPIPR